MDINNITIALRPRSNWESFDLGFIMTRRWWRQLLVAWLMLALPVFAISSLVFYRDPLWAGLIFWWFKPVYEQLPLYFISRAVFNHIPDRREMLRAIPAWVLRQLIPMLTWRRLSLNRSFISPVTQLEGLKGSARRNRIRVLSGARNTGFWLTATCLHLEMVIYLSLMVLVVMFVPWEYLEPFFRWVSRSPAEGDAVLNIFYFCGVAVIAPFYVVSGFSLYLNRRTRLEGWDLELSFEKLARRVDGLKSSRHVAAMLLTLALAALSGSFPPAALAETDAAGEQPALGRMLSAEQGRALIGEIMAGDEFNEKDTISYWRLKDSAEEEESDSTDLNWLEQLFRQVAEVFRPVWSALTDLGYYGLWLLAAAVILVAVYLLPRLRPHLVGAVAAPASRGRPVPAQLFGMAISRESLPEDIAAEALRLFQVGKSRQALGLLYRGSLYVLIRHYGLDLRDSDTEGQCARQVAEHDVPAADYFSTLTATWIRLAYGHHAPDGAAIEALCSGWEDNFRRGYHEV